MTTPNITVLISGSGSNLQALIDAAAAGKLDAKIEHVISSSKKAYGLERAAKADIPTTVHSLFGYYKGIDKEDKEKRCEARDTFNADLAKLILARETKPDLIVCAGWMLVLSPTFLRPIEEAGIPIINLHPALPGAFDGTHAIERTWQAGQDGKIEVGGCMIHYVIEKVDAGEPLLVKELKLIKEETVEEYEDRVHKTEHVAIVEGTIKALTNAATKTTLEDMEKLSI